MTYQAVFKRYELKYLLSKEQKEIILNAMKPYMALDRFGRSPVRNLYFDTDSYRLIRRSIEKPAYKEKLRIRSYSQAEAQSPVFVELKKKYRHVVYKRRISMSEENAMKWLCRECACPLNTQIADEINYFLDYYGPLHPTVFLSYEREAYYSKDNSDFRVTFDDNILCRRQDLSLKAEVYGNSLLSDSMVLMEIKSSGGIPLWMARTLSEHRIYKTSFSKYGTAYQTMIFPNLTEVSCYA